MGLRKLLEKLSKGIDTETIAAGHIFRESPYKEDSYRLQCEKKPGNYHDYIYEIQTDDPVNYCPFCGRELNPTKSDREG